VGVGLGYRRKEFDNFGIAFDDRVARFEEGLELIKRLWTEEHVEHHGTHFDVDGEPHLRPWQRPHPPLWIGAQSAPGVRRAARLGDAWPIGPRLPIPDIRRLQRVYADERSRLGLAVGPQPLRRDVSIGSDRDDALRRFLERAVGRYHAYAANERRSVGAAETVEGSIASHLVFGTLAQCVDTIRSIDEEITVDPVIVRPSWPDMDPASVVADIDRLGELASALG
jgi:alkanesulfonate monooxygenase SsuD/methylene tetrahydromethanopterin reductase-like flavin-dependent oxidoreductase (luciferase family)